MERFIIKYNNGKFRQQRGINETYSYMINVGVISWIIDTQTGEITYGDKDEMAHTEKISAYNDASLITPKL